MSNVKNIFLAIAAGMTAAASAFEELDGGASGDAGESTSSSTGNKTRGRGKTTKADKTSKSGPKHSKSEVQAALNEVKEGLGVPAAKKIIADAGFDKMADITEDKFDEVYDACKAAVDDAEGDDDGDDGL